MTRILSVVIFVVAAFAAFESTNGQTTRSANGGTTARPANPATTAKSANGATTGEGPVIAGGQLICQQNGNSSAPLACGVTASCAENRCGVSDVGCLYRCSSMLKSELPNIFTLKGRFVIAEGNVISRRRCIARCSDWSEVIEVSGRRPNIRCRCSRVRGFYMAAFPRRYVDSVRADVTRQIYFLRGTGAVAQTLREAGRPALFYALDDVSGGTNLGTLDPSKATLDTGKQTVAFSVPGTEAARAGQAKFARGVGWRVGLKGLGYPSQAKNASTLDKKTGWTVMVWTRQNANNNASGPIIDSQYTSFFGKTKFAWHLWNFNSSSRVYLSLEQKNRKFMSDAGAVDNKAWNNIAFRASGDSGIEFFVNTLPITGRLAGVQSMRGEAVKDQRFGTDFQIGQRIEGKKTTLFNGAVAHVVVFARSLNDEQLRTFAGLMDDPLF